ncbi:unnamed protein product [Cladocopium goreaui]|uniref:Modification methylase HpaII n=1 Tax=Cladocopium goreaui TaxID=2562237 RepID=A0A9P1CAC5_9DINO|nr:unnamed protein product [Cladocopium goreaui]
MAPSKADYCCGHWVDAALNVLGDRFASGWEDPWKEFRYGSDCSGLDAPYWALQMLTKAVEDSGGGSVCCQHLFASEAPGPQGLWQKRMLEANLSPGAIYDDMLARGSKSGIDWKTGQKAILPTGLHLYTGGFECQDSWTD